MKRLSTVLACVLVMVCGLGGCGPQGAPSTSQTKAQGETKAPKVVATLVPGEGQAKIVTALLLAGKTLWIGTKSGLYSAEFTPSSRHLELVGDAEASARFDKLEITDLAAEGDRLLAGTAMGFASHDTAGGWASEETGRVNAVALFHGTLYAGRSDGIEQSSNKSWAKVGPQAAALRNQTSSQFINSLAVGKDGELWAGTKFGLLHCSPAGGKWDQLYGAYQDIKSEKVVTDELGNCELAGNYVNQVRFDVPSGKLLVSTDIGLSVYDGKWQAFTGDHQKYVSKDDNLMRVPVKGNIALPSAEVRAAALEDATLWIGTRNGLARLSGAQLELFDSDRGLPDDSVRALAVDGASHTIFAGTDAGVAVIGYE